MRFADLRRIMARMLALFTLTLLAACGGGGGGGGGGGSPTQGNTGGGGSTTPPVTLTNFTTISVDDGPAAIQTGSDASRAVDVPYVTVTICVPGTSTCQTIDHVLLDTGSVGLRIASDALNAAMLAGLPRQTDTSSNPVGECYGFVDGYTFGSVRTADFQIGGASVSAMPIDVIGDSGAFATVPQSCSSGGGDAIDTVKDLGANGVIGIGTSPTDCGTFCTRAGGFGAATYYDCPSTGCSAIITRAASTTAPFQQLPNPIAAMAKDNNGTMIVMPSPASQGSPTLSGTLYFGIGTETNNGLGSAKVLTVSQNGDGFLTATYKGTSLPNSFVDSGSSAYYFTDSSLTACTSTDEKGFYCPAAPVSLTPTLTGANNATQSAAFTLDNADTLFKTGNAAVAGLGANPNGISTFTPIANSFDFGFPFFYGRTVYTAIEGRSAGNQAGPFVAF